MAVSVEAKNVLFCFEYEYILSNFISSNETRFTKPRILGSYIPSYKIACIKLLSKIHIQEDNARKAQAINPMGVIWLCKKCVSTASLLINDIDYEFPNVLHHKKMAK